MTWMQKRMNGMNIYELKFDRRERTNGLKLIPISKNYVEGRNKGSEIYRKNNPVY